MRIIHVVSEKGWRGGEQQIAYLIDELSKKGVTSIAIVKSKSSFEKYCIEQKIKFYSLPFLNSGDIYTAILLTRIARQEKADIIHAHSSRAHSMAFISTLLGLRVPLVISRRVVFPIGDGFFTRWKYNHRSIKKIICVSHAVAALVNEKISDKERCVTIHSGIDLKRFNSPTTAGNPLRTEFKIDENKFLIGNTSALSADKDLTTFIQTIGLLKQKGVPVKAFIIGKGADEASLKEFTTHNNLNDTVIFTGFKKNIAELLPCLDVFMLTSISEGLGTSILDAFAAKVPVVASETGGIPEMVIHKQTGLLAKPKDANDFAQQAIQLFESKDLRKSLVHNASLKIIDFSKEVMTEKTYQVYKEICKQ